MQHNLCDTGDCNTENCNTENCSTGNYLCEFCHGDIDNHVSECSESIEFYETYTNSNRRGRKEITECTKCGDDIKGSEPSMCGHCAS